MVEKVLAGKEPAGAGDAFQIPGFFRQFVQATLQQGALEGVGGPAKRLVIFGCKGLFRPGEIVPAAPASGEQKSLHLGNTHPGGNLDMGGDPLQEG